MKTFCSAQDIEELAAQGKTELVVDEDVVLTDLARHTAEQLGVRIVYRSRSGPAPATAKTPRPSAEPPRSSGPAPVSKPRGCQHAPLSSTSSGPAPASNNSTTVVDQLVGLVKRLGTRGPGG